MMPKTPLQKAQRAYEKARANLVQERDRKFPPGTCVVCKLTSVTGTVTKGSLYADRVFLDNSRHNGLTFLEVADED